MRPAYSINEGKTILNRENSSRSDAWKSFKISKRTLLNKEKRQRVTLTSGTTAPDGSVTTPVTLELSCAFAGDAANQSTKAANKYAIRKVTQVRFMCNTPFMASGRNLNNEHG